MNRIIAFIIILCSALTMSAEPKRKFDPEAYRAEQHKYIQCKAQLTCDEATKFFAIYDEMRTKERQLFIQSRKGRKNRPETEEECRQCINMHDSNDIQLKKIQQLYHKRMLKVLPAKKVLNAIIAAEDFDRNKFREMSKAFQKQGQTE